MNKWIVFDVDDVIVKLCDLLHEAMEQTTNKKIEHWTSWKTLNFEKMLDLTHSVVVDSFIKMHVLERAKLELGVINTLAILKNEGYKIGFLTARGWHPRGETLTHELILKYKLPVDKLVVVKLDDNKEDFINLFDGRIELYIDDNPKHIRGFIKKDIPAILMSRPWNIEDIDLNRVFCVTDITKVLRKGDNEMTCC